MRMMYPPVNGYQIKKFSDASGIPARVSAAQPEPIPLEYMSSESIVNLVALWLEDFYKEKNLFPPTSIYPFEEAKIRDLGRQKPTVRKLLGWCADNFKPSGTAGERKETTSKAELAFKKEIVENLGEYLEDVSLLQHAMKFSFSILGDKTVEGVKIQKVVDVEPKRDNADYISFRVIGTENGKAVKIGVSILQESHGKGVTAGLKRLIQYNKFDITRGCLVRSKTINPRWAAQGNLDKLLSTEFGGKWVMLKAEEVRPLIAILSMYDARNDYGLSEDEIKDFIDESGLVDNNPLLRQIMSAPSGQIPTDAVDE